MLALHLWLRGLTGGLRESLISPCRDKSDRTMVLLAQRSAEQSRGKTEAFEQQSHTQPSRPDCLFKSRFKGLRSARPALRNERPVAMGSRVVWTFKMVTLISSPVTVSRRCEREKSCLPRTWPSFFFHLLSLSSLFEFTPHRGNILTPTHARLFQFEDSLDLPSWKTAIWPVNHGNQIQAYWKRKF